MRRATPLLHRLAPAAFWPSLARVLARYKRQSPAGDAPNSRTIHIESEPTPLGHFALQLNADVAAALTAGYVGVKLDGDIEKAHVKRFGVAGYPTMVILDPATDKVLKSVSGYQSSAQVLALIK